MAINISTAVKTNQEIADRNHANQLRISNTLAVAQNAVADLDAMATEYAAYLTELTAQVGAMTGSEPDYATWLHYLNELNGFVGDFQAMKAQADAIVLAITPLV